MAGPRFGGHKTVASRPRSRPVFICYSKFSVQLLAAIFPFTSSFLSFLALDHSWHFGRRTFDWTVSRRKSCTHRPYPPSQSVPVPSICLQLCLTNSRRCRRKSGLNVLARHEKTYTTSRDPGIARRLPLVAEEPGRMKRRVKSRRLGLVAR